MVIGVVLSQTLTGLQLGEQSPSPTPSLSESATPAASASAITPSPLPTSTREPTPGEQPVVTWSSIELAQGEILDVQWLGGRFVAVGSQDGRAAAWTLEPGSAWQPAEPIDPPYVEFDPQTNEPGQSFVMSTVTEHDGQLVAFGWKHIGCCDNGQAATWVSTDGRTWAYRDPAGTTFGSRTHSPIQVVVNSDDELVLLSGIELGSAATIWISADGLSWQEFAPDLGDQRMMYALAAGDGMLLGIGTGPGPDASQPLVWSSSDGRSWTEVTVPADATELLDITYDAAIGTFAIGGRGEAGPQAWFSTDGVAWSTTGALAAEDGRLVSVSARNGLLAAVGLMGEPGSTRVGAWLMRVDEPVGAQESVLAPQLEVASDFTVAAGDGVHLVEGAEPDGAGGTSQRTWYGVAAVP